MTSLEKRALWGLITGVVWAAAFFAVFFSMGGVDTFAEDDTFRTIMSAIMVIGAVAFIVFYILYRKAALADERERLILIRASDMQLAAVFFVAGGWMLGLGLSNHIEGQISVVYLPLIIMSMAMASMISQAGGILFWSRNTEYLNKV